MITSFEDFCTWMYVTIDDLWQQLAPVFKRPGPVPVCSDSELMTMALVGECRGWDQETELIAHWRAYPHLFPHVPERSWFNRRRRHLMLGINLLRHLVLRVLDVAQDRQCAIDALPVPVAKIHLAPAASREWAVHGAAYGTISTKKEKIYGYKLHLLVTLGGVILDFELVPANTADVTAGADLLSEQLDLTALGDKGFRSAALQQQLWTERGVYLHTLSRRNQIQREPEAVRRLHNHFRQIIETVNGQLAGQFHIEQNHAHTFWGLCARLYTKLTAHTLCISLNRHLGTPDWLQIKGLAFGN
jgi:hypothetical protein